MYDNQDLHLRTDLHTHLAAILPTETLISFAKNHGINESDIEEPLDIDRNTTFSNMTNVYQKRNKLIRKLIKDGYGTDFFKEIAHEYQKHGIEYAEITTDETILSKIVSGDIDIDSAEKEYGVSLKFLLQIHRDRDAADNINSFFKFDTQDLMTHAKYIKGVDICGQEANSTEIKNQKLFLEYLINYIEKQNLSNRDFVIRIHSGETTNDKTGILDALTIIRDHCEKTNSAYPWIRFGHAFHGINEDTIKMMKTMGVSVDFNLTSNSRLNNLNQVDLLNDKDLANAIALCQKYEVPIFLGTDGFGLYHTTPTEQLELAKSVGVDVNKVVNNEKEYLEVFNDKTKDLKLRKPISCKKFDRYKLSRSMIAKGIKSLDDLKNQHFKDKVPISILGGSFKTRTDMSVKEYESVFIAFYSLLNVLDPKKVFFTTSGLSVGPERFFHNAINSYNFRNDKKKHSVLGLIPTFIGNDKQSSDLDLSKLWKKSLTHAKIITINNHWGEYPSKYLQTLFDGNIPTDKNGLAICIGGGSTVKDFISLSLNGDYSETGKPIESWLYTGSIENLASKEMFEANKDNKHAHSFNDAETLIKSLYEYYNRPDLGLSPNQIFRDDFDINKLGEYVAEAKELTPPIYLMVEDAIVREGLMPRKLLHSYSTLMISGNEVKNYDHYIERVCKDHPDCSSELKMYLEYVRDFMKERYATEVPKSMYSKRYNELDAQELKAAVNNKDNRGSDYNDR